MPGQAAGEIPGFIAPMLATGVTGLPPDAAEFVAEVKWDGLRACVAVAGGQVRAWSRSARNITAADPELGLLVGAAGGRTLVLDGEIVALSGPRPDFTALQRRMTAGRPGTGLLAAVPVMLIVFDVLRSGREDLAGSPYVLRRALLDDLGLQVPGTVQVPPAFPGDAAVLLAATRDQGWEGACSSGPPRSTTPGGAPATGSRSGTSGRSMSRSAAGFPAPEPVHIWPDRCSWVYPGQAHWSSPAPSAAACPWPSCAS